MSRLKKRLKRVEVTIDELVLLQHGCTEHFHRAGQFITAIRGHGTLFSVGVDAPMMEGLEACFVQLQLARLLIDGVKVSQQAKET